jgi:hypothetical protein
MLTASDVRSDSMDDVEYQRLAGPASAAPAAPARGEGLRRPWARRVGAGLAMALGVAGTCAAVVSSVGRGAPAVAPGAPGEPGKYEPFHGGPWSIPRAYEVRVTMRLPYSGLVEEAFVRTDKDQGCQRIEFYPGQAHESVHLFNDTGLSYQVVPELTSKRCFSFDKGPRGAKPQDIFPKRFHELFSEDVDGDASGAVVNGVACRTFKYEHRNGTEADADGYLGEYRFYLNRETLEPVQLHFVGHNVFFGGSHIDEYVLDYSDFKDLSGEGGVKPALFAPPAGMPCTDGRSHTAEETASEAEQTARREAALHPGVETALLHPEGEELRAAAFGAHCGKHGLAFASDAEERFRRGIFHSNLRHVQARNRQDAGYKLAVNHLAHLTDAEMAALRGASNGDEETLCRTETLAQVRDQARAAGAPLPRIVDWANGPQVLSLPPGDQGSCGSCWTFGATGALEAAIAKATGKLVPLSKQNVLDCALGVPYLNHACGGGGDFKAYEWVINNNGGAIATEESYPYMNQPTMCRFDQKRGLVGDGVRAAPGAITDCVVVTERYLNNSALTHDESVEAFIYKLATVGPLAISINAEPKDFYFYQSGLYSSAACKGDLVNLDHAVLAVGYNLDEGYVVIRNSWSSHWGEGGYARLQIKGNTCGFATLPTYAIAEAAK